MRHTYHFFHQLGRTSRGFTLTEVLLAVMIIGLIGISLAALTRAASREGSVGRSKIMLRNNLSTFVRTLRQDMAETSYIPTDGIAGELTLSDASPATLLKLAKNVDSQGAPLSSYTPEYVTYCFKRGTDNASPIVPSAAYRGGAIYRVVSSSDFAECDDDTTGDDTNLVLNNVKYISPTTQISSSVYYPVPLFTRNGFSRNMNSLLDVKLIVELRSNPVVNDVIEETFAMPMGY